MRFSLKYIVSSLVVFTTIPAYAEIAPQSTVTQTTEEQSLVSRVMSKNSPSFNTNLNQLSSLTVTKTTGDKVISETVKAKIDLPEEKSVVEKLNTVASTAVRKFSQTGVASWYGRQFHGRKTASGETFDMNALTAAHRTLPLNCYVRVTNEKNGKSVVVKINDRGPFHGNRVLDLSYGAAKKLGIVDAGSAKVRIERVDGPQS
ncbi:septal ring lytic transglycosylase RlpA family protein [Moraxella sp. ZY21109]|nr:septal ring lytic transglycosylase RlpA family protein [Moraxella sp. ZY210820]WLF83319.1 septal ring lytic transglycosylase RlpA family protein [Moraxella sp. ZY210820]